MNENYLATSSIVAGIGLSFVSESNNMWIYSNISFAFYIEVFYWILYLAGWMWWGRRWWPWSQRWGWGWWGWSQRGRPQWWTECLPPEIREYILGFDDQIRIILSMTIIILSMTLKVFILSMTKSTLETSEEEPTPAALNEATCQKWCSRSRNSQFTWRVFAWQMNKT